MTRFERFCISLRHSRFLRHQAGLWNVVRPFYDLFWRAAPKNWSNRNVNGTDVIAVQSRWRDGLEKYEYNVWPRVMEHIHIGDTFIDVGAHIGLYAIAAARRVGQSGRVVAFEPDPENFAVLKQHLRLNNVDDHVVAQQFAIGSSDGSLLFQMGSGSKSRVACGDSPATVDTVRVAARSLDSWCGGSRVDILKIDVEGFEHSVLQGATRLLGEARRRPRIIFIEVHPYAWTECARTSEAILSLLRSFGYEVAFLDGTKVSEIRDYGEIIAHYGR